MKPTDELKKEHHIIARAVSALPYMSEALEAGKNVDLGMLRDEIDFAANFTDKCHHRKEEEVLFPAIAHLDLSNANELIAKLTADHRQGRTLIGSLNKAVTDYDSGNQSQQAEIARLALAYHDLLLRHIRLENTVFFKLVEDELTADKKLEVAERFEMVEEELEPGYHEKYVKLADKLHRDSKRPAA